MFHAEKMRALDFPFAVKLANTMDWNMAESDFEFMQKLEPDGCFVLFNNQEPVGIATCISYGKTGWFGNLAVKKTYRRRGAGSFLVEHAVDYLRGKGVETVGLYAYPSLVGFYRNVGFQPHGDFVVFTGKPLCASVQKNVSLAGEENFRALIEFHRQCFWDDRGKLLEQILRQKGNLCYCYSEKGEVTGFVAAKVYAEVAEIGPLVCRQDRVDVAVALAASILGQLSALEVYVCVSTREAELLEVVLKMGLKENFHLTRMFLGAAPPENCVYLPESLERG